MSAIRPVAPRRATPQEREGGQILVIFALALIVIIGMVGLILDTGSTFAQRRGEQNAADLAAVAGANAYMNTSGPVATRVAAAKAAAILSASRNGYTHGVNGAVVPTPTVTLLQSGAHVRLSITAPHANTFSRVYGANSWDVSVEAAAITGVVDTAVGAAPWIMHADAFNADGSPKYGQNNPQNFGETNADYPTSQLDLAWTDYNGNNNVNSNEVDSIINRSNIITGTFTTGMYIGQANQGNHTTLFQAVNDDLAGVSLPVPIVGPGPCKAPNQAKTGGCFVGWAMFHIISASGGASKHIRGYFTDTFVQQPMKVGACPAVPTSPCGEIVAGSWDNLIVRLAPLALPS